MEMPEQEIPVAFSQMLQMFPNIPHDIIWIYVQRYSSDIEKCAQMLNLQNGKYTGINLSLDNNKYLNEHDILIQPSHIMPSSKTVFNNNNEIHFSDQLPLINNEVKDTTNEGVSDNQLTEYSSVSSQKLHSSPHGSPSTLLDSVTHVDSSCKFNSSFIYHEPLALHVSVEGNNDGCLHSWRPNLTADALGSDFFLPSPMLENSHLNTNHVSNMNTQHGTSEIHMNPEGMDLNPYGYNFTPVRMHHGYPSQNETAYGIDIASHLHYQKSQMNAIRYEVIKAKIELSDLKETEEKLLSELKEKMQSKSVQDIEKLNEEIVQLRLECQCMCTEVDCSQNNQVLLGEVDEECYVNNDSSSTNSETQCPVSDQTTHSRNESSADVVDELHRWQCPQCTFANHPAIKVCEMCHEQKPSTRNPPYLAPSSCYCHPKEESLSVLS